jgi:hypothetical protein
MGNCCNTETTGGQEPVVESQPLTLTAAPVGKPPVGEPSTFTIEIEKGERTGYGAFLDRSDAKNLIVHNLADGAVAEYNKSVDPSKQLLKSDFIVSVNGKSIPADCLMEFKEPKVTCVVTRGFELSCILERENLQMPLGLTFPAKISREGLGLPIVHVSVDEGAANEYNSRCAREQDKLQAFDRILSIDGETGHPPEIKEKIEKATGRFKVMILRASSQKGSDPA